MLSFILLNAAFLSFGGILYLVARSLPRIEEEAVQGKPSFLDRWATSELPEKVDMALNTFFLKTLRKFKVFLLRVDNVLTDLLHKVRQEAGKSDSNGGGFKELLKDDSTPQI